MLDQLEVSGHVPAHERRGGFRLKPNEPASSSSRSLPTVTRAGLARLREAQVDLGGRRVRPARGDDLAARVEVDPLRPVDVRVAEEARLPAAERVVGDRHRDRHVDPDHARLDLELELARRAAVAREDRRAVAVRVLVDEPDGLVVGVHAGDAEHRPEDLVAGRRPSRA